jgi:hypothetical protein
MKGELGSRGERWLGYDMREELARRGERWLGYGVGE